jgi:gliding motility-associated-like protein
VHNNSDSQQPSTAHQSEKTGVIAPIDSTQSTSSNNASSDALIQIDSPHQALAAQQAPASTNLKSISIQACCELVESGEDNIEAPLSQEKSAVEIIKITDSGNILNTSNTSSDEASEKPLLKMTIVRFAPDQLKYLFITSVDAENFESWEFGDGESSSEFSVSHEYETDGNYTVTMQTRTSKGDIIETQQQVSAYRRGTLEMPNIFTPNGDGHNDTFNVLDLSKHIKEVNYMVIKGNNGDVVYESNSLAPWDGLNTRGVACEPGSYLYSIVATDVAGNTLEKQGVVVLKR